MAILIPIATVYLLYWRKKITSIELSVREERPLPLVINLVSYSVCFLIFRYIQFPSIMVNFLAAVVLSAAFSMFISLSYKISLHMVAWGTLAGVILAFSLRVGNDLHLLLSIILLITGVIASARLWLQEHDFQQIISAWLSAFVLSFLIMTYL